MLAHIETRREGGAEVLPCRMSAQVIELGMRAAIRDAVADAAHEKSQKHDLRCGH